MSKINEYFESIVNADAAPVVICDIEHKIIYMNPSALSAYGNIVGTSILNCHNKKSCELMIKVTQWFQKSKNNNRVHTFYNEKQNKDYYMIALRNEKGELIGYYEKHEAREKDPSPFYDI